MGLHVDVEVVGVPVRISRSIEYAIYRVAQEALTNAARHAAVGNASLRVSFADEAVALLVRDEGVGFVPAESPPRPTTTGATSMRDRANEIGAELRIESEPGRGTAVRLVVPLRPTMVDHA
jgi:signal transduction histidine kinase